MGYVWGRNSPLWCDRSDAVCGFLYNIRHGEAVRVFFKSSVQTNGLHRLLGVWGDDDEMDALCGYMLKNRAANGVRQTYAYDGRGQLLAVKNADGSDAERYAYDKAGNMLKKRVNGKTTTFTFDDANQLVSSTTDGVTTRYAYDAAGRMVREGSKTYRYGYLDKVMSVTDGDTTRTFTYHADGQLASASCDGIGRAGAHASSDIASQCSLRSGDMRTPQTETFLWDGLALIQRGDEQFVNEPHVGGGTPVASSKGTSYFNDALGTTVGSKSNGKYSAAALTAFGEDLTVNSSGESSHSPFPVPHSPFFTGKPYVEGLGHAFLMRNYRAGLAKWQTADPMGYPDGWNRLAYCGNGVTGSFDVFGAKRIKTDPPNEHYDKAELKSTYLWTSYDYFELRWYNLYWDYYEQVHHSEYDIYEIEDSFFSRIAEGGALYTVTTFLAGCLCYAGAGVSAYFGAVPVTLVCLGAGKACITAAGVSLTISVGGALASEIDTRIEGKARFIKHCDDKETIVFGGKLRKEYFE